ncbi:MAG: fibrillarin-like rRNA/tRNA 2'-O-methyltransferase [Candidatus Marsarchaeota archaeon]|jgi:fibrillarin-like pre-rRNA processing protein|nr:fibrillarin-like rRNA/tRNA 2'-O-methyltransferase [Candidatus Marsarchaeota archaeon]
MKIEKLFDGVFRLDGKLATPNLSRGKRVYDEALVTVDGIEYRTWNPYRSKLAAAIVKGMSRLSIKSGSSVLYLGAATGTTVSHVSDIAGPSGRVYAVEISERSMRDFIKVCEARQNVLPILQDARKVEAYAGEVGTVDAIYEDIAAPDQAEILIRNSELLKKSGFAYVAIKSQSINVSRNPKEVYSDFIARVSERFRLVESVDIEPFDKMHLFVVLQKR